MAQLPGAFDSNQYDDMNNFEPIPADKYTVVIKESSLETTKKKDGKYISFKFEIIKGNYKGRLVWTNLNIVNPNPVAVEIAQKELATICRACKKTVVQDTMELHGIPFELAVKTKPASGDYPAKNVPTGYKPLGLDPNKEFESNDGFENTEDAPWGDDDKEEQWGDEQTNDDDIPF